MMGPLRALKRALVGATLLGLAGLAPVVAATAATGSPAAAVVADAPEPASDECGAVMTRPDGTTWQCSFVDHFDGSALDAEKWIVQDTRETGFRSQQTCFTPSDQNVLVHDGVLDLTARSHPDYFNCKSPLGNFWTKWTGGMVGTRSKFSQTYGRFEVRAAYPAARTSGIHGGFWMNPLELKYGVWPGSGEIDIAEWWSSDPTLVMPSLHFLGRNGNTDSGWNCRVTDPSAYHTYGVEWLPTGMTFYIDGTVCFTRNPTPNSPLLAPQPFDHPFSMILNMGVGTPTGTNKVTPTTPFPSTFTVDYAKAWRGVETPEPPPPPAEPELSHDECGAAPVRADGTTWDCSFIDEFDGSALDTTKWVMQDTRQTGLRSQQTCYTTSDQNVRVHDGVLDLITRDEGDLFNCKPPVGNFWTEYTGGMVATRTKFSQTYGRFEVRASFPTARTSGVRGGFSMLPEDLTYGALPASGQINVADWASADPLRVMPSLTYTGSNVTNDGGWNCKVLDPSIYHTYTVEWSPTEMTFFIDGTACFTRAWSPSSPLVAPQPFDKPFNLALNLGVGPLGGTNKVSAATPLPSTFTVDYAKAWRGGETPAPPPPAVEPEPEPEPEPTYDACGAMPTKADGTAWSCSFVDDFDGSALDTTKWVVQDTRQTGLRSAMTCYTTSDQNVRVHDGVLDLITRDEGDLFNCKPPVGNFWTEYTGGMVSTRTKFSQAYGRFEVRAAFPTTRTSGVRGGFTMLPDALNYGTLAASGQINVADWASVDPLRVMPSLTYTGSNVTNDGGWNCKVLDPSVLHTYTVEWSPTQMKFFIDGTACFTRAWTPSSPLVAPQPFDKPFHMALNMGVGALGGNNKVSAATPLPATYTVDYVKTWR